MIGDHLERSAWVEWIGDWHTVHLRPTSPESLLSLTSIYRPPAVAIAQGMKKSRTSVPEVSSVGQPQTTLAPTPPSSERSNDGASLSPRRSKRLAVKREHTPDVWASSDSATSAPSGAAAPPLLVLGPGSGGISGDEKSIHPTYSSDAAPAPAGPASIAIISRLSGARDSDLSSGLWSMLPEEVRCRESVSCSAAHAHTCNCLLAAG